MGKEQDPQSHQQKVKRLGETIAEVLSQLTEREKEILVLRFGLEEGVGRTFEEVGSMIGVSPSTIRRVERKALAKLRNLQTQA